MPFSPTPMLLEPIVVEEMQGQLLKGAVSSSAQQIGFYSTYFMVPKKDGGPQPVLNFKHLNQHLKVFPFKTIQTKIVMQSIRRTVVYVPQSERCVFPCPDLSRTQTHFPLCFPRPSLPVQGLPFCLSLSQRIFTRVVLAVWLLFSCRV